MPFQRLARPGSERRATKRHPSNRTYRWRHAYGGLKVDQAKRMKELEQENVRLKRIVASQALDMAILKEAACQNF